MHPIFFSFLISFHIAKLALTQARQNSQRSQKSQQFHRCRLNHGVGNYEVVENNCAKVKVKSIFFSNRGEFVSFLLFKQCLANVFEFVWKKKIQRRYDWPGLVIWLLFVCIGNLCKQIIQIDWSFFLLGIFIDGCDDKRFKKRLIETTEQKTTQLIGTKASKVHCIKKLVAQICHNP